MRIRTILALATALAAMPAQADDLRGAVAADLPALVTLYEDLHANPELSFQEVETAKKLAARARALDFEVTEGVGKTGVVAVMKNGPGPVVLLRADMDGLPVIEQTGLTYAFKRRAVPATGIETGVMHACDLQHPRIHRQGDGRAQDALRRAGAGGAERDAPCAECPIGVIRLDMRASAGQGGKPYAENCRAHAAISLSD
jgi:hypothetical protein